jgi:DNA-binding MarR family transcriptional regulator
MIRAPVPTLTSQDIGEAEGALTDLLERVLANTGTTRIEYITLRVLAARGPFSSPVALHEFLAQARQLSLDQAGVNDLLAGLEAEGLITGFSLGSPGPSQLTDKGSALHGQLAEAVAPITEQLFADFDADDLATAHRVLMLLIDRANRLRAS